MIKGGNNILIKGGNGKAYSKRWPRKLRLVKRAVIYAKWVNDKDRGEELAERYEWKEWKDQLDIWVNITNEREDKSIRVEFK